jgi:farnesyl-diphosphate farnesyltransferase
MQHNTQNVPSLEELLEKTSRTFALAIPLLEAPLREHVVVAYLLLRIADTFEDAVRWSPKVRCRALGDFAEMLVRSGELVAHDHTTIARWVATIPSEDPHYLQLVRETPRVLGALASYGPVVRSVIVRHVLRTCDGMARTVANGNYDGTVTLTSVQSLKDYCYIVAGIVGELLTDLFVEHTPALVGVRDSLDDRAAAFGEGLQLVNILKDRATDAVEGRKFLPDGIDISEIFSLARTDLLSAQTYIATLQYNGAHRGIVAFCALPVLLAWEALTAVERDGAGTKMKRERVLAIAQALEMRLSAGDPAVLSVK